jgi:hypothetical protein
MAAKNGAIMQTNGEDKPKEPFFAPDNNRDTDKNDNFTN